VPIRELVSRDLHRMMLGGSELQYVLVRRRGRRGVGLKVDESGLTVSAPATMPVSRVEGFVRESERWVARKVEEWSARRVPEATFTEGSTLPYLGNPVVLRVEPASRNHAELVGVELIAGVRQAAAESVRRTVVAWYRRVAQAHLSQRVMALSLAAGLAPPRFLLSSAMGRWGSCNSRREVRLAWRLMKARRELVDYVVCHELAHLRHMNHSSAFWGEVERQCPDYRALRAELFATDHLYRAF
jgi:predicted metal-dependent hydrolase